MRTELSILQKIRDMMERHLEDARNLVEPDWPGAEALKNARIDILATVTVRIAQCTSR